MTLTPWKKRYDQPQFGSVAQSCPTLCDPMNRSTPGLPVHHQLLEFNQTHVHRVSDAIQPSHPLSSPSPPTLNLSQYQGLFQWVSSLHQVTKVLEFQLQHQSFQWIFRVDFLLDWPVWSLCFPRDPQESSPKPQFKSISSSTLSHPDGPALIAMYDYWRKRNLVYPNLCWKILSLLLNMLSRFATDFLPRIKHLLISWV